MKPARNQQRRSVALLALCAASIVACSGMLGYDDLGFPEDASADGGVHKDGGGQDGSGPDSSQGGGNQGGVGGSAGTHAGGSAGSTSTGGAAGSAPLACDSRYSFSDNPAVSGKPFVASFTDSTGYAYVDMTVSGSGTPSAAWGGVAGSGPFTWSYNIQGHAAGTLHFAFFKDKNNGSPGTEIAACDLASVGGGAGGSAGSGGTVGQGGAAGSGGSSGPPPVNRYGMGYVSEGNASDHDLTSKLAGPGGYVLVIFADVRPDRHTAEQSWKDSISAAYARDLIPVIRMAPPWGNRNVRAMGESPTAYKALGKAYADIIADLPKRADWPMYVHVHNEPNLCYEWVCDGSGWLDETTLASEYAHMLSDVADAVHALGDPRIKVTNGGLAPGSVLSCECGGSGFTGGTTALTYLQKMMAAVPGVFDKVDVFASHSYPSEGEGWGFFEAYDQAGLGLHFFEKELQTIGKPNLKVILSETGWAIEGDGHSWSRDQVADFTVKAYQNVWLTHPSILGVTPFILRDGSWDKFAWVEVGGNPYPVYNSVRAYRCAQPGALNCQ